MKNTRIWLLTALMGLAGCKNNNSGGDGAPVVTPDTVLVVGKSRGWCLLVADKKGNKFKIEEDTEDIARFSNVGDTLIITYKHKIGETKVYAVKNLTMEKKIKAFSKQK